MLALPACVIETIPLPELEDLPLDSGPDRSDDIPPAGVGRVGIDESALYYHTSNSGLLVGARRAVPGLSRVVVANSERSNWEGATDAAPDGSFNVPLNAGIGDAIDVSVEVEGVVEATTTIVLEPPSAAAFAAQADLNAAVDEDGYAQPGLRAISVLPPDASGMVAITGLIDGGITVVVANIDNGNAAAAAAAPDNAFTIRLEGGTGDMLQAFVVESAASSAGPEPVTLYVP